MFRERKFTFSWPVLAAFLFIVCVIVSTLLRRRHAAYLPSLTPFELAGWAVFSVLAAFALRGMFPTYAGPDGIRSTDGIGRYHDVRWSDIRQVRIWPGFLHVTHGPLFSALTIPLFLDDGQGFRDYLLAHAPLGNPLREYFARR